VTLADLRERKLVALREDGSPDPLDEQPLDRALADRTIVSDVVYLRGSDGNLHPYKMSSRSLFDQTDLIGIANYISARRPPSGGVPRRA
jgi:hypothetical protein